LVALVVAISGSRNRQERSDECVVRMWKWKWGVWGEEELGKRRAGGGQAVREIVIGVLGILNGSGSGDGRSCTAKQRIVRKSKNRE
jgi:hypothetical protein